MDISLKKKFYFEANATCNFGEMSGKKFYAKVTRQTDSHFQISVAYLQEGGQYVHGHCDVSVRL